MKKITEESLPKVMKEVFEIEKNWSKTYIYLLEKIKIQTKNELYASMDSNFRSIFIYELIKGKLNIDDFKSTIQTILKSSKGQEVEHMYSRFFDRESEVGLVNYIKKDRFNNNFSCWTNMEYIFLDLKAIQSEKYKYRIFLNKETLPYLSQMLTNLDSENISSVYGAGIHKFVMNFIDQPQELVPLIKIAQSNPAFELETPGYNRRFIDMLIKDISSESYRLSEEENAQNFKIMKENIKDFEKRCERLLIAYKDSANNDSEKIKIDLSVLNFLLSNDEDVCAIIHHKFLESYNKIKKDNMDHIKGNEDLRKYHQNKPYRDLIGEISSSIYVGLDKKKFKFNINQIEIDETVIKNFVYFKFLDSQIKNGNEANISMVPEVLNYIEKSAKEEKIKDYSDLSIDLNWDAISKYCQYLKLESKIQEKPEKLNKSPKRKI